MRVAKWGNSLAVRIPSSVAEALELKEGDDVEVKVAGARAFEVTRDDRHDRAMERIRSFKWSVPDGWTFDRDEANAR